MPLLNASNPDANWHEVLALWSRLANWTHYKPSERELNSQMKQFLIAIWSEKDWLKSRYPTQRGRIERFVRNSEVLSIVGDLANTAKHRELNGPLRSGVIDTNYYGRVSTGRGVSRRLHFLRRRDGTHVEVMYILRSALDELEEFRFHLLAESNSVL